MKTAHTSAFAPRQRDAQSLLAVGLVGALASVAPALRAQEHVHAAQQLAAHADDTAEIAKKLQNPIASMISAPIQSNFDFGAGPNGDGFQYKVNLQPVIPFSLSEDWNLISRTIFPIVYQEKIIPEVHNGKLDYNASQAGLSDTTLSLWFSPKDMYHGWTWGVGPAFLFPTATDDLLGTEKWAAGPTAIVLKQEHGWTYGALVNHMWDYTGEDGRDAYNASFLQPFLSYTFKSHTTTTVQTESIYNWDHEHWTVPVHALVSQLVKFGKQPVQFQLGGRYYAEAPDNGPQWGLRFTVTFVFPEKH